MLFPSFLAICINIWGTITTYEQCYTYVTFANNIENKNYYGLMLTDGIQCTYHPLIEVSPASIRVIVH